MGRNIKSDALISFFALMATSVACTLFPGAPEPIKTPQVATATNTPNEMVAVVASPSTIPNTVAANTSTATPQATHIIYVIVTATPTITRTPKPRTGSTATTSNQQNAVNQEIAP